MKTFKRSINKLLLTALLFCIAVPFANSKELSEELKKARTSIMKYFKNNEIENEIDPDDESINFRHNGVLYWITFNSTRMYGVIEYTLHQQSIRIVEGNDNPRVVETTPAYALYAANQLTANHSYNAAFVEDKVVIKYVYYTSNTQDFISTLPLIIGEMDSSIKDFMQALGDAEAFFKNGGNSPKKPEPKGGSKKIPHLFNTDAGEISELISELQESLSGAYGEELRDLLQNLTEMSQDILNLLPLMSEEEE